jgi:hypothetical protein
MDEKRIQIDGQPRLKKTQLTNWFTDNKKWITIQHDTSQKNVWLLKRITLINEERLISLREVEALSAQGR